jgi:heat shock protein HspQ
LYYLSAATFTPAEEAVRKLANDTLHPGREKTFVHLLHEEDGLRKLSNYLMEVPLASVEEDMDYISNLINGYSKQ